MSGKSRYLPDDDDIFALATGFSPSTEWLRNRRAERTCHYVPGGRKCNPGELVPQDIVFTCDACHGMGADGEFADDPHQLTSVPEWMLFCPYCGAKVVGS